MAGILRHSLDEIPRQIIVQTRKGTCIDNIQYHAIAHYQEREFDELETKYRHNPGVTFKGSVAAHYNCHGMVFASSRTTITDSGQVSIILADDGYEEIDISYVMPGDIVLYMKDDYSIDHSGIVLTTSDNDLKIPKIISKWGRYKVAIHYVNQGPYDSTPRYFRLMQLKGDPE